MTLRSVDLSLNRWRSWVLPLRALWPRYAKYVRWTMIAGVLAYVYTQHLQTTRHEQVIIELKTINALQRRLLVILQERGRIPSDLVPEELTKPRKLLEGQGRIAVAAEVGTLPGLPGVIVHGMIGAIPEGRSRWVGIQSGLEFWPQIRLRPREDFRYRIAVPPGVTSAAILLAEVGSETTKWFEARRLGPSHNVGVFLPHVKEQDGDFDVLARVDLGARKASP